MSGVEKPHWLSKLLSKWACKHKWELYHRGSFFEYTNDPLPIRITDTLICKYCGKIQRIKL